MSQTNGDSRLESRAVQEDSPIRNVVEFARRRKWIIATALVLSAVGGVVFYLQQTPVYECSAQILLTKKLPNFNLPGIDSKTTHADDYMTTQQILIQSPLIVGEAVKQGELEALPSFAEETSAVRKVRSGLTVRIESVKDRKSSPTNVFSLSFRGPSPEDNALALTSVIGAYENFLEKSFEDTTQRTLKLITRGRDILANDLAKAEVEYRDFRQTAPSLLGKQKDGGSVYQERLSALESRRSALVVRQAELKAQLDAIETELRQGRNRATLLSLLPMISGAPNGEGLKQYAHTTLHDQLAPLQLQERMLLETFDQGHPQVQAIQQRIQHTRSLFMDRVSNQLRLVGQPAENGQPAFEDPIAWHVQLLKKELSDAEKAEQGLSAQLERERKTAQGLLKYEMEDERLRNKIDRLKQLFDTAVKQLQEADILKSFGGLETRVISPVGGHRKVEPQLLRTMQMALIAGLIAGVALGFFADVRDKNRRPAPQTNVPTTAPERVNGTAGDRHPLTANA